MLNIMQILTAEERQIIYNFAYIQNYTVSGSDLKQFIQVHNKGLSECDFKTAARIETFLLDVSENTTSKRTKNKILKFLSSVPDNLITVDIQKYKSTCCK